MRDQVIIITGASSGIGAALARELGRQGAKLALAARDESRLQAIVDEYPGTLIVPTDVTDEAACRQLVQKTVDHFGRLDVLVNNAGVTMWAMFEEIDDLSMFRKIMDVNYFGAVYCTHAALPHLKESGGLLVGVSSLTGKTGVPTRTGYAASKHAMQGFFDSLRIELMDTGVDVCVISPGFVRTEMRERAFGADGQPLGESHIDETGVISAEEAARMMAATIKERRRELVMGSFRIKLGMWLKLIAPSIVDNMARKAIDTGKS